MTAEAYHKKGYVPVAELPENILPPPVPHPELPDWTRDAKDGSYRSGPHRIERVGRQWKRSGALYNTLGAAKLAVRLA